LNLGTGSRSRAPRPGAGAAAAKRGLAAQIEREMRRLRLSKADMAARMKTSRSALNRLLDPGNLSVTLRTLGKVAAVLGKRLHADLS
jgi:antitoxin HicB